MRIPMGNAPNQFNPISSDSAGPRLGSKPFQCPQHTPIDRQFAAAKYPAPPSQLANW